jgi:hypothetical protein
MNAVFVFVAASFFVCVFVCSARSRPTANLCDSRLAAVPASCLIFHGEHVRATCVLLAQRAIGPSTGCFVCRFIFICIFVAFVTLLAAFFVVFCW